MSNFIQQTDVINYVGSLQNYASGVEQELSKLARNKTTPTKSSLAATRAALKRLTDYAVARCQDLNRLTEHIIPRLPLACHNKPRADKFPEHTLQKELKSLNSKISNIASRSYAAATASNSAPTPTTTIVVIGKTENLNSKDIAEELRKTTAPGAIITSLIPSKDRVILKVTSNDKPSGFKKAVASSGRLTSREISKKLPRFIVFNIPATVTEQDILLNLKYLELTKLRNTTQHGPTSHRTTGFWKVASRTYEK